MRFAEQLGRHATEASLLAVIAGEPAAPHVASCAGCQARLADLRAWTAETAAGAAEAADAVFTAERLAAQRAQVLRRLEAAGRSARVIAFPVGTGLPARSVTARIARWTAAAAAAGLVVGVASGRFFDTRVPSAPVVASAPEPAVPLSTIVSTTHETFESLDEAALLDAAYDRVAVDALRTIDDITPRAREVVLASGPRRRP
jgi:hypothetical protein